MTEFEQFTLENAIERFGINRQLAQLAKECGELTQAAMKSMYAENFNASLWNLAEEMADVEIVIDQFRLAFPRLIDGQMGDWREKKIDYLAILVEEASNG